ncbi:MAG: hypothetical protein H6Q30_499 [Bacteroidetes bacterium]|nr:hypothetical protein [Bacteroidota bacterium]
MQDLLTIAEILALLCVSALCVYLIVVLARLKETLGHVEKEVKDLAAHALPILENTEYITARLKSVAENVDDQVLTVRESIASIREIADNVVALERKIQERIEGPVLDGVSYLSAIVTGIRTFIQRVRA